MSLIDPILVNPVPTVTLFKYSLNKKALYCISITESGMIKELRLQPLKAFAPIIVTCLGYRERARERERERERARERERKKEREKERKREREKDTEETVLSGVGERGKKSEGRRERKEERGKS